MSNVNITSVENNDINTIDLDITVYKNDTDVSFLQSKGDTSTISVGTVTTLVAGSTATVDNSGDKYSAIFDFGIPKGDKGDAATIAVGKVTTLKAGSAVTITNSGTTSDAVFDFGIPKGLDGTGMGDMLASVYDPAGKAKQVAFEDEYSTLSSTFATYKTSTNSTLNTLNTSLSSTANTLSTKADTTTLSTYQTSVTSSLGTKLDTSTFATYTTSTTGVTAGTYTKANITVNAQGKITSASSGSYCTTVATTTTTASATSPAVVVQNYVNGNFWYRVWSDGWVEQGGIIPTTGNGYYLSYLKSFITSNYTLLSSKSDSSNGSYETAFYNLSTSGCSVAVNPNGGTNQAVRWYACGY